MMGDTTSNRSKRIVVIAIAVLFVCMFMITGIVSMLSGFSLISIVVVAVCLIFSAMIVYYAVECIKEIDEGVDDDVDNY